METPVAILRFSIALLPNRIAIADGKPPSIARRSALFPKALLAYIRSLTFGVQKGKIHFRRRPRLAIHLRRAGLLHLKIRFAPAKDDRAGIAADVALERGVDRNKSVAVFIRQEVLAEFREACAERLEGRREENGQHRGFAVPHGFDRSRFPVAVDRRAGGGDRIGAGGFEVRDEKNGPKPDRIYDDFLLDLEHHIPGACGGNRREGETRAVFVEVRDFSFPMRRKEWGIHVKLHRDRFHR